MVYELQPFNRVRFDACMAWVSKDFDRAITQYEAIKIHALADVRHVVEHHRPIIGGTLRKLPYGPADVDALNRTKQWAGDPSAPLRLAARSNRSLHFVRKPGPSRESMFTPSERQAIVEAARTVFGMNAGESIDFFHGGTVRGQDSALGRAWAAAGPANARIGWESIIDAHAAISGVDAGALRALICVGDVATPFSERPPRANRAAASRRRRKSAA